MAKGVLSLPGVGVCNESKKIYFEACSKDKVLKFRDGFFKNESQLIESKSKNLKLKCKTSIEDLICPNRN